MIEIIILLIGLNMLLFFSKKNNLLKIMMFFELMILLANLIFLYKSHINLDPIGITFVLITLAVAACETSIGLALFTIFYDQNKSIEINKLKKTGEDKWYSTL